jgi:hypothetical protein
MLFEQDRVLVRLQQRVLGDASIVVCFLSGSFGRRSADAYSDLDVALVFADAARRDAAWAERRAFVQSVLPYVGVRSFDAVGKRPFLHIALYSNGAIVEYRYETQETLQPDPRDRDIRILKDDGGWAEGFQAASAQMPMPQPRLTAVELEALDERFWVMLMDVYRLLKRGDYDKPFTIYLELLHFTLPPLLRVLPSEEPARQALLHASFSHDTKQTLTQLADLMTAYVGARTAVIQRFHLPFTPEQSFESAMQRLIQK